MSHEPESGRHQRKTRKRIWALAVILIGGAMVSFGSCDVALFPQKHTSTVLVLDNCDADFKTPPFEDAVIAFGPNVKPFRIVTNLNVCQTVGGSRSLCVSHDGRFLVCARTSATTSRLT